MLGILQATVLFDLGFIQSVAFTVLGGMVGVLFFALLDRQLLQLWRKVFKVKPKTKIHFNKRKRLLVKIKMKYGLAGIALLTPIILQVPIGTILAMRMIKDIKKVCLYMFISFTLFSVLCCGIYYSINPEYRESVSHIFKKH